MIRPAARRLRQSLDHLGERVARGPAILLYHRVASEPVDPFGLCVSPGHFAEHLAMLAAEHEPVSLAELVARIRRGEATRREVAVTFDDGYRDNLDVAVPLLERHGIPATFFIATAELGGARGFWWDALDRALLPAGEAPQPAARRALHAAHERLVVMPPAARQAALGAIGADRADRAAQTALVMTREQVRSLAARPGMTIGAHSVSHSMLTRMDDRARRAEIRDSRSDLEQLTAAPVNAFAYPYGDFDEATIAAVRDEGIDHACTCVPQRVARGQDLLCLPRLEASDCDGETFARALAWSLPRRHAVPA